MEELVKEGREQGIEQGLEQGIKQGRESGKVESLVLSIRNLMKTMNLTAKQAMDALLVPPPKSKKKSLLCFNRNDFLPRDHHGAFYLAQTLRRAFPKSILLRNNSFLWRSHDELALCAPHSVMYATMKSFKSMINLYDCCFNS